MLKAVMNAGNIVAQRKIEWNPDWKDFTLYGEDHGNIETKIVFERTGHCTIYCNEHMMRYLPKLFMKGLAVTKGTAKSHWDWMHSADWTKKLHELSNDTITKNIEEALTTYEDPTLADEAQQPWMLYFSQVDNWTKD